MNSFWKKRKPMTRWFILDRDGTPLDPQGLPERPAGAQAAPDDAFTPWYKQDEHLHVENGAIQGIHARGESLKNVRTKLDRYLEHEARLIEAFGGTEDILLPEADRFLKSL